MSLAPSQNALGLSLEHQPWAQPLLLPAMSNEGDRHARFRLTSRYLERNGAPYIPVTGEMHYSRVPRAEWRERLLLMKSGGITAVASYVFWNHHEPTRGRAHFDGNRDLRAFVELCAELELDFVLRLGPWCHGESRYGGFPDWVQHESVAHRTDDPRYLKLVRTWFERIGAELTGLFTATGPIIAIQIENELYDQPQHIATLKQIARDAGMWAPIWTATGWGGAELPEAAVMPLFGGYGDGFWVDFDAPWDVTFREHFFYSHVWDDPGIGADLREHAGIGGGGEWNAEPRTPSPLFPGATCELGGGMAKAYHRRPRLAGLDVAAVAHNKIGNGSAWQGYYMYTGGTNPAGTDGLQESHGTGYPNDLARFDYDFGAPIGATGRLADAHAQLRRQHAFLDAFGSLLAPMPSTLPDLRPQDIDDVDTLRWAVRSDGRGAFVFVSRHQPFIAIPDYSGAQFSLGLGADRVVFPERPIDIPSGTLARWPVNLIVGGVLVRWATATALTVLSGDTPTLVLTAEPGIDSHVAFGPSAEVSSSSLTDSETNIVVAHGDEPVLIHVEDDGHRLDVLVLPPSYSDHIWVVGAADRRRLLISHAPLWLDGSVVGGRFDGELPTVREYDMKTCSFVDLSVEVAHDAVPAAHIAPVSVRDARPPSDSYGSYEGRASAPSDAAFEQSAMVVEIGLPDWARRSSEVDVSWAGDVARLVVDGTVVNDQFWSGVPWVIDVGSMNLTPESTVQLHILPLHPRARVGLPDDAQARRLAQAQPLCELDSITVRRRGSWRESTSR